nr:venom serine protease Bi-VSP-like [Drosophila takahashii]
MKWIGCTSALITLLSLVLLTTSNDAQFKQVTQELQECAPLLMKQQDESLESFLRVSRMVCGNQGDQVCCPKGQTIPALNHNPTERPIIGPQFPPKNPGNPFVSSFEPLIEQRGPSCRGPDTKPGYCIELNDCDSLLSELRLDKPKDQSFNDFLRVSRMVCGNEGDRVCCPKGQTISALNANITTTPASIIPRKTDKVLLSMEDGCGYTSVVKKKIVGGVVSQIGAWPWIALLGYNDPKEKFKCGGALITARHVITAAHCIVPNLTFVRLGEHDLSTDLETRHEDIQIEKKLAHPEYNPRIGRSDLGILYLVRNAEFTTNIRPICLPYTPNLRQKSYLGFNPFVAGWGKTMERGKSATLLNELQIPVIENSVCRQSYAKHNYFSKIPDEQFDSAVLCAGDLSGGKDTCQGDSGGPLMMPESFEGTFRYHLIGVVSYGISGCGRPNVPSVLTSTQYFMDWIIHQVHDMP